MSWIYATLVLAGLIGAGGVTATAIDPPRRPHHGTHYECLFWIEDRWESCVLSYPKLFADI